MYQINAEKFGKFLREIRTEKCMTQRELAEKLFVSDKTVSKWERGASMPNVALLIPLADTLEITVTELLKGEKIDNEKYLDTNEVENLVVSSLDLSVNHTIHQRKKNWILAYLFCVFITVTEIILLLVSGLSMLEMRGTILLVCGSMLVVSGWFCFFVKDLLPTYYDNNKINYITQGIFRIHMVGLSFNNGNWSYISNTLKISTMLISVVYPLICYGSFIVGGIALWDEIRNIVLIIMLGFTMVAIYIVGKKYE
ncbi:MAG TPA: helix-turn-helix transcriptional regulator [Candidatus Fimimorpha faecalis]|uniref:Helix-turn-helix transcriptional regulator n=1 Tax=Candidatus Fimimorpha faecalis TaxID=2840824 RepID=A0A9D1JDT9_9FIRM|nr:helix-turn-helix transcriptional regulator [Candidatus Fimimorpha faecalis]